MSAATALETQYARSGDVSIAFQVVGNGPIDLVLVMGWVTHLEYMWQEPGFARFLRRLASFSRLILFDKRGTGLSDRGVGLPSLEQRMDDVRAVMDAVGSERAALLGISEGGAMCTLFAATYPRRTSSLALFGCFPRRLWAADYPWGALPEEREQRVQRIERGWGGLAWAERDLDVRAPTVARDADFQRWWSSYLRMSASPGAAVAMSRMNDQIDVRPVLSAIRVPTLVVHRSEDQVVPAEVGQYMAGRIPGARYVQLPGHDHLPFAGDQDAVLDTIEEFLTGVRPTVEPDRVLATVLAIELVDAAHRAASVGERRWREIEATRAAIVRAQVERYRGRAAGTAAGSFLATFDGPARAIHCALAIIEESRVLGSALRAGLHTGECDLQDGNLGGLAPRVATWIMAQAEPGDVLASSTMCDLIAGSGIQFEERAGPPAPPDLGAWRLVGLARGTPSPRPALGVSRGAARACSAPRATDATRT